MDSDAQDDSKPLKFTTVPTWQAFMSPVHAPPVGGIPEGDRAAPANVLPTLDSSSWLRETTRLGGIRFSRSPILLSRGDSSGWVQHYSCQDILVERWDAPKISFALWLGPEGRYPTSGYPLSARPVIHDFTEAVETIRGTEFHLASFRLIKATEPPAYHVHAYWRLRDDIWARVAACGDSRTAQEHLLVMVRSAEPAPQSGVAV
jgi:hypothetical protein